MIRKRWMWLLLPVGLGLAGVMLLVRVTLVETNLFPEDLDALLILFGFSAAIFASVVLVLREVMEHWRQQSMREVREEAFAAHLRFLRRFDHELKNPLTALRAGLRSLAITLADERQCEIVHTLENEAQRLSRLVSELRKLTELETSPVDAHAIDIHVFLAEVVELERERISLRDRQFSLELPPETEDLPPLVGDQDLLLVAVHNLLDNAFKYTRTGDRVSLQASLENDGLVVRVSDTGIGISEAEIPLVWEELYRGKNAENIPGNGIGLALVKAIVERHNGSVSLQSQDGSGTTVTLRLPRN